MALFWTKVFNGFALHQNIIVDKEIDIVLVLDLPPMVCHREIILLHPFYAILFKRYVQGILIHVFAQERAGLKSASFAML